MRFSPPTERDKNAVTLMGKAAGSGGPDTIRAPLPLGRFNRVGLWTMYQKEVQRFLSVPLQTLIAPPVTALLFMAIFTFALGRHLTYPGGLAARDFLACGLIIMTVMQNAFANTSSSMLHSKMLGNIGDVLMPPLTSAELTFAYLAGGVTRGLLVGVVTAAMFLLVTDGLTLPHPWLAVYYSINACVMMGALGLMGGIYAQKFDHMAALTNFVITPLLFLSGTFYSVTRLPETWRDIALHTPFFQLIAGFRYSLTGYAEGSLAYGMAATATLSVTLTAIAWRMLAKGYRLKP